MIEWVCHPPDITLLVYINAKCLGADLEPVWVFILHQLGDALCKTGSGSAMTDLIAFHVTAAVYLMYCLLNPKFISYSQESHLQ